MTDLTNDASTLPENQDTHSDTLTLPEHPDPSLPADENEAAIPPEHRPPNN